MDDDVTAERDAAVDDLEAVLAGTEKLLGGVAPDQAHRPTPCPGFDVSQLIDHMLGWSASYAVRAWGGDFDRDANAHQAGPDPVEEFRSYADHILAGYRRGDGSEKTLPVGVLLMDYEVHGWDLARATGQAVPFDDREAGRALEAGRQMLKPEYRGPDQEFGAEVPVAGDASAMDQLVAFLGRDPAWAPPST